MTDDPQKSRRNPTSHLAERVTALETDMKWVKKKLETIDRRTWWILGSVVAFGIISIIIALLGQL